MCQTNPVDNFNVQMYVCFYILFITYFIKFIIFVSFRAKLAHGLCSGRYSTPPPEVIEGKKKYWNHGIRPNTLKLLVGKNHPEFATKKQQDAQEFFLYLLSLIEVPRILYYKTNNFV